MFAITIPQAVKKPTVRGGSRKFGDFVMFGLTMAFAAPNGYSL